MQIAFWKIKIKKKYFSNKVKLYLSGANLDANFLLI